MKRKPALVCSTLFCLTLLLCLIAIALLPGCAKRTALGVTSLPASRAVGFDGALTSGLRKDFRSPLAALPGRSEELWILARGGDATLAPAEEAPGSGALMAKIEEKEVPMPLKHTDVHASVSGYIGAVEVTQQFLNPYSSKIEAVYVFPLPHNAAVNEFIMTIGERRIRGIIRERQEARADLPGGQAAGLCRLAAHRGAAQRVHAIRRQHRAGQGD